MLYTDGANVQWLHVDVGVGPTITSPAQHSTGSRVSLLWLADWWRLLGSGWSWQWTWGGGALTLSHLGSGRALESCLAAWLPRSRYQRSPRQHQHQQPGSFSTSPAYTNTSTSLDIATYHHTETKICTAKLYWVLLLMSEVDCFLLIRSSAVFMTTPCHPPSPSPLSSQDPISSVAAARALLIFST